MTRIRFIEWLLAIILVIALHGAALTGWVLIAPGGGPSALLPAATPAKTSPAQDSGGGKPIDIAVTLIEPDQSPEQATNVAPANSAPTASDVPAASDIAASDDTAVPQEEVVDLAKDTSQIAEATPEPAVNDEVAGTTTIVELQPQAETAPSSAEEPDSVPQTDSQTAAPPVPVASATPLRDPVPLPKTKPAQRPTAPPHQDDRPAEASTDQVASAEPSATESATDQPVSAAQTAYYRQLIAKITKARIYPGDALRDHKEGTVYMQIVIKKDGRITSYDIIKSSGHKELDDAAVQTLVRANPGPPFPDEVTADELRVGVPLRFQIDPS